MTGVVVDVTMRLLPIETSYLRVDTERAADLDDLMSRLSHLDAEHRYSVAWVDCLAKGTELGRGVVTGADHALWGDLESRPRRSALDFAPRRARRVPFQAPSGLLNSFTVTAFNELWFRKAPRHGRGQLQGISPFFHPLDGVGSWNRLYGRRGFVQYQFVVPPASAEVVRQVLERLRKASVPAFLGVLKRFGPGNPGPLSFPMEGWTLALDLPLTSAGLGKVLDGLDELVAGAGGRVYLAKDARLRPELVEVMYPGLRDWRPRCHELDPLGVMDSDLARRLDLMGRCRGSR